MPELEIECDDSIDRAWKGRKHEAIVWGTDPWVSDFMGGEGETIHR